MNIGRYVICLLKGEKAITGYVEASNLLSSNLRRGARHSQADKEKELEVGGSHPDP